MVDRADHRYVAVARADCRFNGRFSTRAIYLYAILARQIIFRSRI
jgi:hypothetical protein